MDEDEAYRASSQYRLWSFTSQQLHERRTETNQFAGEKVRAAFARASNTSSLPGHGDSGEGKHSSSADIDTLTVEEEQMIVQWGCEKILQLRDVLIDKYDRQLSYHIVATAIQYLRRFYLVNSPMTYHPSPIVPCAVFLALKAEHRQFSIGRFTSQIKKITPAQVRAPEFLLMQALRFTLDVHHPMKGLEGCVAELKLRAPALSCFQPSTATADQVSRIDKAHTAATSILNINTQMTDAYFLYTPPQIYLAALLIVDKELTNSYLTHLFDRLGTQSQARARLPQVSQLRQKLLDTVTSCADMIRTYRSVDTEPDAATKKEINRIGRKLKSCQDPEKVDIVAVANAKKQGEQKGVAGGHREGEGDGEREDEKKAKKRKIEAGKTVVSDGDVFGGELKR